jgi:hypothetical protein
MSNPELESVPPVSPEARLSTAEVVHAVAQSDLKAAQSKAEVAAQQRLDEYRAVLKGNRLRFSGSVDRVQVYDVQDGWLNVEAYKVGLAGHYRNAEATVTGVVIGSPHDRRPIDQPYVSATIHNHPRGGDLETSFYLHYVQWELLPSSDPTEISQ